MKFCSLTVNLQDISKDQVMNYDVPLNLIYNL